MTASGSKQWGQWAVIVGIIYFLVGFGFAAFARWAVFGLTAVTWNRLAFLFSAIVFAVHIVCEQFRFESTPRRTAWHTSVAVALGALGLALAANINDLSSPAGYRSKMLVALVAWPLITAVPAFFVALIVATVLNLVRMKA